MTARSQIAERKAALLNDLRAAHREGLDSNGNVAIKQRELSERYGLSIRTISLTLQELVDEGVLYTVPRIGTFIGRPRLAAIAPYVLLSRFPRSNDTFGDQIAMGFEDKIAQLGGSCLTLTLEEMKSLPSLDELPLSGIFFFESEAHLITILASSIKTPRVTFGSFKPNISGGDCVDFDDEEGGEQAARHLLNIGHRKIAFLALNCEENDDELFPWSSRREKGWRKMMEDGGQDTKKLVFRPEPRPIHSDSREHVVQIEMGREAATKLLQFPEITAIVVSNGFAAEGLLEILRETALPPEQWPAILCFDDVSNGATSAVSYLRLPWEKIGAEAAQLMWERQTGRLTGPPQKRLVKMNLIPRLTCRSDWAGVGASLAHHRVVATPTSSKAKETRDTPVPMGI